MFCAQKKERSNTCDAFDLVERYEEHRESSSKRWHPATMSKISFPKVKSPLIAVPVDSPSNECIQGFLNDDRLLNHENRESRDMKVTLMEESSNDIPDSSPFNDEAGRVRSTSSVELESAFAQNHISSNEIAPSSVFDYPSSREAGERPAQNLQSAVQIPPRKNSEDDDLLSERIQKPDIKMLLRGVAKFLLLHIVDSHAISSANKKSNFSRNFVPILNHHQVW